MDGFGIIISVGFSDSSIFSLLSKLMYVRKEDVLDMISLLVSCSFVWCNLWLLVMKFLL